MRSLGIRFGSVGLQGEGAPPPPLRSLIEDVYAQPTAALEEQLADLERVRAKRG